MRGALAAGNKLRGNRRETWHCPRLIAIDTLAASLHVRQTFGRDTTLRVIVFRLLTRVTVVFLASAALCFAAAGEKAVWKPVQFAIVRYNDDAPASWNIYHGEKRGILLVRLWRRYLLVNVQEEEVFEIDPATVKVQGENVEWAPSDAPTDPVETSEWKARDVGPMRRVRFRFGKTGNFLDIQLPLLANGKPAY